MSDLLVGYARVDITPSDFVGIPLGGHGNEATRVAQTVLDPIYATCVAASCEGQTVLLISRDLIDGLDPVIANARKRVSDTFGIPVENVIIAGTHTHAAPSLIYDHEKIEKYRPEHEDGIVKAAELALADLSAATVSSGSTKLPGLAFVRHYKMADGTIKSANTAAFREGEPVDHGMVIDDEMNLVKFTRQGKKDILLMNWQAHACFADVWGNGTQISADYIGVVRSIVEQKTGMNFVFFLGAAGNQTTDCRIPALRHKMNMEQYGQKLADGALTLLGNLQPCGNAGIRTIQKAYEFPTNRKCQEFLEYAKKALEVNAQEGRDAANAYARAHGMQSVNHAYYINQRSTWPDMRPITINALNIAGIGFTVAPYEMFSTASTYIKKNSPTDTTVIISCANGKEFYIPSKESFDYFAYESLHCRYAQGTSEALAEKFVELLEQMN